VRADGTVVRAVVVFSAVSPDLPIAASPDVPRRAGLVPPIWPPRTGCGPSAIVISLILQGANTAAHPSL
jgi:hypothetical protein